MGAEAVGLRELRQHASDIVRRAEQGEELLITVNGRAAAVMGPPPGRGSWRRLKDVAAIWDTPADPSWNQDRDRIDNAVTNPWDRA